MVGTGPFQGEYDDQVFDMKGTHALLGDRRGNYETALAIKAMVQRGAKVTVVTPFLHFGANLGFTYLAEICARPGATKVVGDAYAPRSALEAIREGGGVGQII